MTPEKKPRMMWTPEEVQRLRREWKNGQPIRLWVDKFPGRSEHAINTKALHLKLDKRGGGPKAGNSASWNTIKKLLAEHGPMTDLQLANASGWSRKHISDELARHHATKEVHVADYAPKTMRGRPPRLWAIGRGKDAVPPAPMTIVQIYKKRWRHIKQNRPDILAARSARQKVRHAEKVGKLIRRDVSAAWITAPAA